MIAEYFLTTVLLHQTFFPLNFSEIGLSWKVDALYVLYNKNTTTPRELHDVTDTILEGGKGYFAHEPRIIADMDSSKRQLKELGSFSINSLIVVMMNDTEDLVYTKANEMLKYIKEVAVVFLQKDSRTYDMREFFENLWQKQLRRIVVATIDKREVFAMRPYPQLLIKNVTNRRETEYFSPLINWNLEGYTLSVPVQMDVPNTFWYYDYKMQRIRLDGIGGRIFEYFMRACNVKLNIYPLYLNGSNALNMAYIERMIMKGDLEVSPHWYTTFEANDISYSYPYITTPRCIIIPMDCVTFLQIMPFQWIMWVMFLSFLAISEIVGHILLKKQWDWVHTGIGDKLGIPGTISFYVICLLMAIPLPNRNMFNIQNTSVRSFARTLLTFGIISGSGFCFSQLYSASMISRLAASVSSKPYITTQQILDIDTPIMITIRDEKYISDYDELFKVFNRKYYRTTYQEFHKNRVSLNTSFMYPISVDRWKIIREQQSYLKYKRFWLSTICYGHYPVQYQLRHDSHFLPYLNRFVFYIRESGLYQAWEKRVARKAVQLRYLRYFKDSHQLEFLRKQKKFGKILRELIVSFYCSGVLLSSLALLMELLIKKYSQRRSMGVRKMVRKPKTKFSGFIVKRN